MRDNNRTHEHTEPRVILSAEDLNKSYGPRKALRGLSFSLYAGRVLGFLGPNGAGKTTSIRILTTIMEPDSGHFTVDGISSSDPESVRRRIGVLPENLGFPRHMTGTEYLTFFGELYGLTRGEARDNAKKLLAEVGMEQRAKSLISSYSHGMRQRLGIARALVNSPVVVFLDEPTLGLDPRGQQELLALIQRIANERKTGVVLCSHLLSEIEGVCDDVIILSSGQVVAQGSVKEVIGKIQRNVTRVRVPQESVEAAHKVLRALPNVDTVSTNGQNSEWIGIELVSLGDADPEKGLIRNAILEALIKAKIPILNFEAEGGRLQDVFLQLTEEVIS